MNRSSSPIIIDSDEEVEPLNRSDLLNRFTHRPPQTKVEPPHIDLTAPKAPPSQSHNPRDRPQSRHGSSRPEPPKSTSSLGLQIGRIKHDSLQGKAKPIRANDILKEMKSHDIAVNIPSKPKHSASIPLTYDGARQESRSSTFSQKPCQRSPSRVKHSSSSDSSSSIRQYLPQPTISIPLLQKQAVQKWSEAPEVDPPKVTQPRPPNHSVQVVVKQPPKGSWFDKDIAVIDEFCPGHGKSELYSTAMDDIRLRKLAQAKAKDVNRADIRLHLQTRVTIRSSSGTKPRRPTDLLEPVYRKQLNGISGPPVAFVNEFNNQKLDGRFQFINQNIELPGVKHVQEEFMTGCSCEGECSPKTCQCLLSNQDMNSTNTNQQAHYIRTSRGTVLSDPYLDTEEGFHVNECNISCSCQGKCHNSVVQNGRTLPLEIFKTRSCGFGLRSPSPIAKGQFIDTYIGELMTTRQLRTRENLRHTAFPGPIKTSYVFSLDYFKDDTARLKGRPIYHIDGERFGGPTRFINHSCDPNVRILTVMQHHSDFWIYNLAFFAIRDIPPGEELCFDYNPAEAGVPEDVDLTDERFAGASICYCGAKKCKRVLWGGSKGGT